MNSHDEDDRTGHEDAPMTIDPRHPDPVGFFAGTYGEPGSIEPDPHPIYGKNIVELPIGEYDQGDQPHRLLIVDGHDFLWRDRPNTKPVWGDLDGGEVLWAGGEPLIIAGNIGVGKTTLLVQLLRGRLGLDNELLGWPIRPGQRNTLYLASDRPNQIAKAMRRNTKKAEHLDRLKVIEGPPPFSIINNPSGLLELAHQAEADTIMIDSLKDIAPNLSDEATGQAVNYAFQICVAEGIEVVANHHPRKASTENKKPNKLDDLYGSTWLTAGAGSVLFLYGKAGDDEVELFHLKQPEMKIEGPNGGGLKLVHDHETGRSTLANRWDLLQYLQDQGQKGATTTQAAKAKTKKQSPTDSENKSVRRALDRLVKNDLASKTEGTRGGPGGSGAALYSITSTGSSACEKQRNSHGTKHGTATL